MKNIFQVVKKFASHSLGRGMMSYGLTFPTGYVIQEYYQKQNLENLNWKKCFRYSMYGIFASAPLIFGWVKLMNKVWPQRGFSTALKKAAVEQIVFAPTSISLFFFTQAFFDNNFDVVIAQNEMKRKFWEAYRLAVCYWPIVQTINFTFIPDRNRVVFVSFCGLLWVITLAYIDSRGGLFVKKSDEVQVES